MTATRTSRGVPDSFVNIDIWSDVRAGGHALAELVHQREHAQRQRLVRQLVALIVIVIARERTAMRKQCFQRGRRARLALGGDLSELDLAVGRLDVAFNALSGANLPKSNRDDSDD